MDEHQLELTRFVREAALRRFGSARSAPMKPWISALTWSFLRLIAPVRRSLHAAFDVAKKLEKQGDSASAKGVQSNGMRLRTKLKAAVKWLVALDKHEFVERKAYDAQIALTTTMFGAVLRLYVLCMETDLELTKRFRKRTVKKLKTRIKENKNGRNSGQRFSQHH